MIEALRRICALQPFYSPINTPEMQERGRLIRHTLPKEIKSISDELRAALGPTFVPNLMSASQMGSAERQKRRGYIYSPPVCHHAPRPAGMSWFILQDRLCSLRLAADQPSGPTDR
jgi:hypothetical protein